MINKKSSDGNTFAMLLFWMKILLKKYYLMRNIKDTEQASQASHMNYFRQEYRKEKNAK